MNGQNCEVAMGQTLTLILELVSRQEVEVSAHGYDEMADDGILLEEALAGVPQAVEVEDYPLYYKGPCVLALQRDGKGNPIHVVWGIPKNASSPAIVVTVYRPDPKRWSDDFMRRKS